VSPAVAAPAALVVNSNDFPSIQAAIDSVRDSGGPVRIPAGTHLLPAKVRVYSNVTVFGDGMDRTILKFASGVQDK
jgi:polygalacturonase